MADENAAAGTTGEVSRKHLFLEGLGIHWRFGVLVLWPFVSGLVFIGGTDEAMRCLFVVVLMAGYWICEVLPLGVTGLLPIGLFPLLAVLDTKETVAAYFSNTTITFMCSILIALSIETSNLHNRIALRTILFIGTTHLRLTFGFMAVTMFVSMWIVNTAATAMMAPIVLAVLNELEQNKLVEVFLPPRNEDEVERPYPSRTTLCYFFGISYAATIGGIGTLIGTGTNLTFKGIFEARFPEAPDIQFAEWTATMSPQMLIMNGLTWVALSWQYLGLMSKSGMDEMIKQMKYGDPEAAKTSAEIARRVVQEKYNGLGKLKWAEAVVIILFVAFLSLLITADPSWMPGWAPQITSLKVAGSTPALLIVTLMFAFPMTLSIIYCMSKDSTKRPRKQSQGILNWERTHVKMLWGFMFLLGSGFALAKASNKTGLSKMIGGALSAMKVLPPLMVLFVVCFMATNLTEFTSNVAVANIILPVISELAVAIEINPTYLMLPATVCCSFSFMMPVGTPPNALISGYANIRNKDMVIAGILPTIITLLVLVALFPTYGSLIYSNLQEFPKWATNSSTTTK